MSTTAPPPSLGRRRFLGRVGGATVAASVAAGWPALLVLAESVRAEGGDEVDGGASGPLTGEERAAEAFRVRLRAARFARRLPLPRIKTNGDEEEFSNKIASYSKALPHNPLGEVDPDAYDALTRALSMAKTDDFELIPLGGTLKLENPQAGLCFELQGPDSHKVVLPPPPAFKSAEEAGEMVELYWMALTRDVPFAQYDSHPLTLAAADELSRLSDFRGPKVGGRVTPDTLFRGGTTGDLNGPYVSQFLLKGFQYGALTITQRIRTTAPGVDHMTTYDDWLSVQNGRVVTRDVYDLTPRFIRSGRDIGEYVHNDPLYQSVYHAALILFGMRAARDAGNPYRNIMKTQGFSTFGAPFVLGLLASVMTRALNAVWFNKWYVHRRLRPEEFGGRVHNLMIGAAQYPVHPDVLNSQALEMTFVKNGSYLLPQAFPEGCPTHPAYGAGHAAFAAAGVTILKAFFDETFVIPNPAVPTADGTALIPYVGSDLTVGGELNKLASNIGIPRNIAGVHWRTDADPRLGEAVAIGVLRELRESRCFAEDFSGFSLTKFDGTTVTL